MITVECPWCAGPATVEADDTVDCAECEIRVDLAPPPVTEPIARAA